MAKKTIYFYENKWHSILFALQKQIVSHFGSSALEMRWSLRDEGIED